MEQAIPPTPAPSTLEHSPSSLLESPEYEDALSQPRYTPATLNILRPTSHTVSRYQSPDLLSATSHSDPIMAYTQVPHAVPCQYTAPAPEDIAVNFDTESAPAPPQTYSLSTPDASPRPLPSQLADHSGGHKEAAPRATQSMKALGVKSGRIQKSTPKKKMVASASPPSIRKDKTTEENNSNSTNSLDQPLSILTKDWDIPSVDINAYVHRPLDERREEVDHGKVPGKVKRAMNAFMLYRKAYQDRAKKWAQQSNHQVVSKVCGRSWSIEPESVRNQFNNWAVIERDNHRKAHPEYKFTPSKSRKKGKDDLTDDSDIDDPEWGGANRLGQKRRSVSRTPLNDLDTEYRQPSTGYGQSFHPPVPEMMSYQPYNHRPTAHLAGFGRQPSVAYSTESYSGSLGHYRAPPGHSQHQIDGTAFSNPPHLAMGHSQAQQHTAYHGFDLATQYLHPTAGQQPLGSVQSHTIGVSQQIDPSLTVPEGLPQYDMAGQAISVENLNEPQWQPQFSVTSNTSEMYPGSLVAGYGESYITDRQLQYIHGDDQSWKVESVDETEDWQPLNDM